MANPPHYLLAGDIGGTHTRLRIARMASTGPSTVFDATYASRHSPALEPLLQRFFDAAGPALVQHIRAACIAVAGPVRHGEAQLTNLPWRLSADALSRQFNLPRLSLVNDFEAQALGLASLTADDLVTLQAGTPEPDAPKALIGAGTGLGACWLAGRPPLYQPLPSEIGHTDFAPADALDDELVRFLRARFDRATWEDVLSGPGLENVFQFLRHRRTADDGNPLAALPPGEMAAAVSQAALAGHDETAVLALDLFIRAYARFAASVALTILPLGGLYIGGGIAPKMIDKFMDGRFIALFQEACRMPTLMKSIPVHVVRNAGCGLMGAMTGADRLAHLPQACMAEHD